MASTFVTPFSIRLAVVGAGTMGAGITLAALYAGIPTSIYDISDAMLVQAEEYIQRHLDRKGKLQNLDLLKHANKLEDLSKANIIIEAVPEKLALKQELFEKLDQITPRTTTLATNTSTLAVTAIAASVENPERVAGMHFFNPAPVLPLVELVRAARTSQNTLQILTQLAERMGKTPVVVSDTPGFIVNRVARPFYGEALRLLTEGATTHEQIDQIVRLGAGFRMGPFELMDLIGIDINLAAMRSMYEQTFGEPRYRPQQIQVQKVQQGALGKKTGRGFYRYDQEGTIKDPPVPTIRKNSGTVLTGSGTWAPDLTALGRSAGYRMANGDYASPGKVSLAIATAGMDEDLRRQVSEFDQSLVPNIPIICQCADVTLTEVATWLKNPERLVGFDGLFLASGKVATLIASPTLNPRTRESVEEFFSGLGRLPFWVADSPGLVLPRIICMLANEAAFAVLEGVANLEEIDQAMRLGVNYPLGPLEWANQIGFSRVVTVLDHLRSEYGEDRFRAAPILRRWSRLENVPA